MQALLIYTRNTSCLLATMDQMEERISVIDQEIIASIIIIVIAFSDIEIDTFDIKEKLLSSELCQLIILNAVHLWD